MSISIDFSTMHLKCVLQPKIAKKSKKITHFGVQGHRRSLNSVAF